MAGRLPPQPARCGNAWDNSGTWNGLQFKQWQWVTLNTTVHSEKFPRGTTVCLLRAGPTNSTPAKRPGQSNEWQKSPVDTVYRVAKLVEVVTVQLFPCDDAQGAILHRHLSLSRNGPPEPTEYPSSSAVFLLPQRITGREYYVKYPSRNSGTPYTIPDGACGVIKMRTTRQGGQAAARRTGRVYDTGRAVYIVSFPLELRVLRWEQCNIALNSAYFDAVSSSESKKLEDAVRSMTDPPRVTVQGRYSPEQVRATPFGQSEM